MNKQEIYDYLDHLGVWYEITEHQAICTMKETKSVRLPYPEAEAKNLFLRDDKKQCYYLVSVKDDWHLDLKAFRQTYQTRPLSFASEKDLSTILGLSPGSVTPLGLLNDRNHKVVFFLDEAFTNPPGLIGVHPNDNTATVWLKTDDLIKIIEQNGHTIHIARIN